MINKNSCCEHHSLHEVTRSNLVGKTKSQSPARFDRSKGYSTGYKQVDFDDLLTNNMIVVRVNVGDYRNTIAFPGFLTSLKKVISTQNNTNVNLQTVLRAISNAIDDNDLLVDCDCKDFIYRFAYFATKYGYKYGKPETRPPKITNPADEKGAMCKHLTAALKNKRWIVRLSVIINKWIKENFEDVLDAMGLDNEEVFSGTAGRPSNRTGRNLGALPLRSPLSYSNNNNYSMSSDDELQLDLGDV